MKKIICLLFTLLLCFTVYAENITIFGITFGMTKQEIKKFNLDKNVETPMEKAFESYARDIEVDVLYDNFDKVNLISICSNCGIYGDLFQAYWMAYFTENLNCKHIENVYYNDDIVAIIRHTGGGGELFIDIGARNSFNAILDSCIKG